MKNRYQVLIGSVFLILVMLACTISIGDTQQQPQVQAPALSQQDLVNTSVAQTFAANQPAQPPVVATTQAPPPPPAGPPTNTPKPCNKATFINETVADGTTFYINKTFTKSWRFRNDGTCTWNTNYQLVFNGGDQMGGPSVKNFPSNVAPGEQVDLSVSLKAPGTVGTYTGNWTLRSDTGEQMQNYFTVNIKTTNILLVQPVLTAVFVMPTFSVTGVTFQVDTPVFTGACPHTFNFTAGITVNMAGTVKYWWTRSDGAHGPEHTLVYAGAGTKYVTDTWSLGASGSRWKKIYIITPNNQTFGTANFTLNCT